MNQMESRKYNVPTESGKRTVLLGQQDSSLPLTATPPSEAQKAEYTSPNQTHQAHTAYTWSHLTADLTMEPRMSEPIGCHHLTVCATRSHFCLTYPERTLVPTFKYYLQPGILFNPLTWAPLLKGPRLRLGVPYFDWI